MIKDIQRTEYSGEFDVFMVEPDGVHLDYAPPGLRDDVIDSLKSQRERLLDAFGSDTPPGLEPDDERLIAQHFIDYGTTVAPHVVIDPEKDLGEVRDILEDGFLSEPYIDFFAGDEEGVSSPGGSPCHDLVVFYDWREKYRRETRDHIEEWGWSIAPSSLEEQVRLHMVDFVAHELGHMTKGQRTKDVILGRDPKNEGQIKLTNKVVFDFEPLRTAVDMPEVGVMLREGEYYNGPLLIEGMAVSHSVAVVGEIQGIDPEVYGPAAASYLYSEVTDANGEVRNLGINVVHSNRAYIGLQGVCELYPELKQYIRGSELGEVDSTEFLLGLKRLMPRNVRELLLSPSSAAWNEVYKRFPIGSAATDET